MEKYILIIHTSINDLFDSSMNSIRCSKNHFINLIFTFTSFIVLIYLILNNKIYDIGIYKLILIIICIILFPIIQPLIIYIKLLFNYNKYPLKDVEIKVYEDKLLISNFKDSKEIKISDIYDIKNYKNMIVIMYDYIHGQIIPNRVFNTVDKDDFYIFIKNRINMN